MKQTQTGKKNKNTAYGAWGLLLCLLPLLFIKTTHFHPLTSHSCANEHKQELGIEAANATTKTCLICQFELIPCIEAILGVQPPELIHFSSPLTVYHLNYDIPACLGIPTLRAPPYSV